MALANKIQKARDTPRPRLEAEKEQTMARILAVMAKISINNDPALVEEVINNLASDPQAELKITVEINADFPNGASDQIKRVVSENAKALGFKTWTWE
jgi:hypothetical protein